MRILFIIQNLFQNSPRGNRARNLLKYLSKKELILDILTSTKDFNMHHSEIPLNHYNHLFLTNHNYLTLKFNPIIEKEFIEKNIENTDHNKKHSTFLLNIGKLIKNNIFPDSYVFDTHLFIRKAKNILKQNKYDIILTSAFPHSTFIIGWILKMLNPDSKWVMDLGDPWSHSPLQIWSTGLRGYFTRSLEKKIIRKLNGLIVTTNETRDLYKNKVIKNKSCMVTVIPSGIDIERNNPVSNDILSKYFPISHQKKLSLIYTGQFLDNIREPFIFYNALQKLDNKDLEKIRICFIGNIPERFHTKNDRLISMGVVRYFDSVADRIVFPIQKRADILLLFGNNSKYQLPSKVYEYAAARKPILCLRQSSEDLAANFVEKNNLGWVVNNSEEDISKFMNNLIKGEYKISIPRNFNVHTFSCWSSADKYYNFLRNIIL